MSSYIPQICVTRTVFFCILPCYAEKITTNTLANLKFSVLDPAESCSIVYKLVCILCIAFCSSYKLRSECTIKSRWKLVTLMWVKKCNVSTHIFVPLFKKMHTDCYWFFCSIVFPPLYSRLTGLTSWVFCSLFSVFLYGSRISAKLSKR